MLDSFVGIVKEHPLLSIVILWLILLLIYAKICIIFENAVAKKAASLIQEEENALQKKYNETQNALEKKYTEKHAELVQKYQQSKKDLVASFSQTRAKLARWEKRLSFENKENHEKYLRIQEIKNANTCQYPFLAQMYADYEYICDRIREDQLRERNKAPKAAEEVKVIRAEKREILKKSKMLEYQLNCYESLFPWLIDFKESSPSEAYDRLQALSKDSNGKSEYESVMQFFLSDAEYYNLTTSQKYQLALDRYKNRKKTNWQVGIEYERYIGYVYESQGYRVHYHGALLGLEDMGRDLIAESKDEILVIQCKRWAQEKNIHEKHIFQLYGSVVLLSIQHPNKKIQGVFVTTTSLSDLAQECANHLGIIVQSNMSMQDYPLIKCNISKAGEKIYHLPMDLQYDRVIISVKKGDYFVSTVKEAESLGFRRAYTWHGSQE